ncbi:hypothetical protein U1Q18_029201 [Sarracenia purpurea var. burkii]
MIQSFVIPLVRKLLHWAFPSLFVLAPISMKPAPHPNPLLRCTEVLPLNSFTVGFGLCCRRDEEQREGRRGSSLFFVNLDCSFRKSICSESKPSKPNQRLTRSSRRHRQSRQHPNLFR